MQYKDYIIAGAKVVHDPRHDTRLTSIERERLEMDLLFDEPILKVVTIGEYRPYFTDGTPDPTPEQYNGCCQVECDGDVDDSQLQLATLFPIFAPDEPTRIIYKGKSYDLFGTSDSGHGDEFMELCPDEYYVLDDEGDLIVIEREEGMIERDIEDLTFDELKELRGQICIGSLYISDYQNKFGVDPKVVIDYSDGYIEDLYQTFNEDVGSEHETAEAFANYILEGRSYPDVHGIYIIQVKFDGDGDWQGFDQKEYYDYEIDDELWRIKRAASGQHHKFRKLFVGFENTQTLTAKR